MRSAESCSSPFSLFPGWPEWQAGRMSDRDMASLIHGRLSELPPFADTALEQQRTALMADLRVFVSGPQASALDDLLDRLLVLLDEAFG